MALQDQILVVIKASADGAIRELDQVGMSAKGADSQAINLGKTLKAGLVAGATALAGAGLVSYLNDSVTAFQDAQVAASQFARATNATVEEAGKFTTVAGALGLEMNDLIEINAEFSKKVQEQPGLLKALNVEVAKNADGSTNMTKTLVATIDALGQMEDGLLAAQTAAQLFGEEGSKQLAGFYLQGIKVSDLMDRIDFVDRSDDAKEYAAATIEMNLAMQQLQVTIGAALVPVLTELIDAGLAVTGFLKEIPGPVYLIVGAFVAWEVAVRTGLVAKAFPLLIEGMLNVTAAFLSPKLAMQAFGDGLVALGKKAAPLAALAAAVFVVTDALKSASEAGDFIKNTDNVTQSLEDQANQLRDSGS